LTGTEQKIVNILKDPQLSAIKRMLEKDHAIDCLFLLYMSKGKWKDAKGFMRDNGLTLSDGTFRARMIEIEELGLAKSTPIDPLKKYYTITEKGKKITDLLLGMFGQL
jgi:DNA-binding HxlR family transcriptional regulator